MSKGCQSALELLVDNSVASIACELVASYSGLVRAKKCCVAHISSSTLKALGCSKELPVLAGGATTFFEPCAIIKALASASQHANILLGTNPTEKAHVEQGLEFCEKRFFVLGNTNDLEALNSWLVSRTFYASNSISIADLVVCVSLHAAMLKKDVGMLEKFCHVARWFDHIQNLPGVAGALESFPLVKLELDKLTASSSSTGDAKGAKNGAPKAAAPKAKGDKEAAPSDSAGAAPKKYMPTPEEIEAKRAEKAKAKAAGGDKKKAAKAPPPPERPVADVTRLECRVGLIKKVWRHPEADKLYCEEIDIGEDKVRNIASGLVPFMGPEGLEGKRVIVLANLKAKALKGFDSHGMVMCASSTDGTKCEILQPPTSAKIGDLVTFEGLQGEPDPVLNDKKSPFSKVQPDFKTDNNKVAFYKEHKWVINGEPLCCASIAGGTIS